mgnify:CR=1 FL=1
MYPYCWQPDPTDDSTIRFTATVCKFIRTGSSSLDFLVLDVWRCNSRSITADLEAMHRVGLGGAYLMPIKGVEQGPQYEGKAQQLTPEWWRMVTHSMKEADRLGMQLGMHICDGFAWREVLG